MPVDDENCVKWQVRWYPSEEIANNTKEQVRESFPEAAYDPPTNSVPFGNIRMKAKRSNDYLIHWETHKTRRVGIAAVNLQDVCITENECPGPIMDRSKEHLCTGDISTIKARLMLLNSAKALRENRTVPPGARDSGVYRARGASVVVPDHTNWTDGSHGSDYRTADREWNDLGLKPKGLRDVDAKRKPYVCRSRGGGNPGFNVFIGQPSEFACIPLRE